MLFKIVHFLYKDEVDFFFFVEVLVIVLIFKYRCAIETKLR